MNMSSLQMLNTCFRRIRHLHMSKLLSRNVSCNTRNLGYKYKQNYSRTLNFNNNSHNSQIRSLITKTEVKTEDVQPKTEVKAEDVPQATPVAAEEPKIHKRISALEISATSFSRIFKNDLLKVIEALKHEAPSLDQGIFLIKCCGHLLPNMRNHEKIELLQSLFATMKERTPLTINHYHTLLQTYTELGHKINAGEFLNDIPMDILPNNTTYQKLLDCVCETGDMSQAKNIISNMRKLNYPITEEVFNALILGHGRAGDTASARAVIETMETTHVLPSAATYTALIKGLAGGHEAYQLPDVFREINLKKIKIGNKALLDIIRSLAAGRNDKHVPTVLSQFESLELSPDLKTLCINLIYIGEPRTGVAILKSVPEPVTHTPVDSDVYGAFFIREMVLADTDILTIVEICLSLISSGRNTYALYVACEIALRKGLPVGLSLLQSLKSSGSTLRPHYFWPLILTQSRTRGEAGVFSILRSMKSMAVTPDYDTLTYYALPQFSFTVPHTLVRQLQDTGLSLTAVMTPVVVTLINRGMMHEAFLLCQTFDQIQLDGNSVVKALVNSYRTGLGPAHAKHIASLLTSLVSGPKVQTKDSTAKVNATKVNATKVNATTSEPITIVKPEATKTDWAGQFLLELIALPKLNITPVEIINLLKEYKVSNIKISEFAADVIGDHLHKSETAGGKALVENIELLLNELTSSQIVVPSAEQFSQYVPHPRDMTVEELENHLVELRAKQMNSRGVLRRLLQAHCRSGNVNRAIEVLKECESKGVLLSAGMRASIFDVYIKAKDIKNAGIALADLQKQAPWFKVDEHKIIDYATMLVKEGRLEDTINMLAAYSKAHEVVGGEGIAKNCWRLLTAVAESGNTTQTQEFLDLLILLRFCTMNNSALGPVIRSHLNNNDLKGAVTEFKQCAIKHRCTPLQLELMTLLAKKNEAEALQEVVDAAKKVHGVASTLGALAIALAKANKEKQLRKLLLDPTTRISSTALSGRCKRLHMEGAADALEVLANACKGLPNLLPRDIYSNILQIYCRKGDSEEALKLYNRLIEDDVKLSKEFTTSLTNLLESKGVDVPGELKKKFRGN